VNRNDLEVWIERSWVRPARRGKDWLFVEEDIARIDLICDLAHDLDMDSDAVDIILSLVDQVYALRRSLRSLTQAVGELPADSRREVLDRMRGRLTP
jgi:chaperone modulatory protein CbpM